jgi:Flp pilus assembly protein TadB
MLESAGGARWTFFSLSLSSLVALLGIVFVVALVLWSYRARSLDRN